MTKKIALITGAGSGLGKELALLFGQDYHIVLVGRTADKLEDVAAAVAESTVLTADVSDPSSIRDLYEQLKEKDLLPDLLVNNAGVGHFGKAESLSYDQLNEMMHINAIGPMLLTNKLLPDMKKKQSGIILNILSTAAQKGKVNETGYVASKYAFRGYSESLAKEVADDGIRVVRAYMGGMNTPFWDHNHYISDPQRLPAPKEIAERIYKQMDQDEIQAS
ncbi:SDR family NAD(P)-dependent oxidoreductase [Jeotgalibacillus terrae]|uniref:SDR family NAD(P)-dependent oxidoreductase n=1 Tax=Jeotgalibacillus terrae TaxID=587735 RepID=A0ABW5ZHU8_9BACL|nr:SDR family oxidoreductase [Jeotgalibacillus terrae]MBM7580700.1 short-subunit dehydrogenase [Jeotgalibacillus terrae]